MTSATPPEDAEPVDGTAIAPAEPDAAVDGEAVEFYDDPPIGPPVGMPAAPVPAPAPLIAPAAISPSVPVSGPAPVEASPPAPDPSPASPPYVQPLPPIGSASSIPGAFDGHAPEPSVHPIGEIASARPEVLVGAAFAGGILAAMILRRLGS